ncbi:MAG TPA: hypothetical protein VJ691_02705 [Vicinamibacterales bacterium]|nr:hypothetical protein [Vicinamibacterales bacterium]
MLSRRTFLRATAGAIGWPLTGSARGVAGESGQVLYNGIVLGKPWPPRLKFLNDHPVLPPYLADPPDIIPIDVGRQLFVDDFLIDASNLQRVWHHATYHPSNPVLRPETPWERRSDPNPSAMVFSDGVFFDPRDRLFKMWYMGGYGTSTCLVTSTDGVRWTRPRLDVVPGTNIVNTAIRDASTVWLDLFERDPRRRFKMAAFYNDALEMFISRDGVHWTGAGRTGFVYDRSTFFRNPFRGVWGFSLRDIPSRDATIARYRSYWESPDFAVDEKWNGVPPALWVKADSRDFTISGRLEAQLYNLDCVAYESVMLGLFSVWRDELSDREKVSEIVLGYSRDGFHWHRPDRTSFIPVSSVRGSWNWANIQSAGGGCLVVGDELYFYVSGRQGVPRTNLPGICSTGLATLRRDGFASMDWSPAGKHPVRQLPGWKDGMLTTRPLRFSGSHLFVNAEPKGGELRVEVLDRHGRVLAPFGRDACEPLREGGTRQPVTWRGASLGTVAGEPVRFRFTLTAGSLYAFWVSDSPRGYSNGYPAAGGPEFTGPIDRAG